MLLSVFERAVLLNILPSEGNFKTLKCLRELREHLSLNEGENDLYQPKISSEGRLTWRVADDEGNDIPQEVDISITRLGHEIISERLAELDKQKKLKDEHYTLFEKFVEIE